MSTLFSQHLGDNLRRVFRIFQCLFGCKLRKRTILCYVNPPPLQRQPLRRLLVLPEAQQPIAFFFVEVAQSLIDNVHTYHFVPGAN